MVKNKIMAAKIADVGGIGFHHITKSISQKSAMLVFTQKQKVGINFFSENKKSIKSVCIY